MCVPPLTQLPPLQHNGLFICGHYPALLVSERGEFRLHPLTVDGPILSFTTFNNEHCPNGFLYISESGKMRVAHLPVSRAGC